MKIRAKLTLIFFAIVIVVLSAVSLSVYLFSAEYRQTDFYRRLKNRAINTANVLVEVQEVNADLLRRLERNNPASLPNQHIRIYNADDEVLYSSDNDPKVLVDQSLLEEIRRQGEIKFNHGDYEAIGFVMTHRSLKYVIVAAATDVYGLDALSNLRNVLLVTFFVGAFLVSVLGWFYSGRVLSPIAKIVGKVDSITSENLDQRLNEGNAQDELGRLSTTFNRMLDRLQDAFVSQKTFIANASHEIKTPITVMSGEVEVTLLQDREKEYYVRVLRSVLQGLRGLNRLSTQLLVLAQTSDEHPYLKNAVLRIDDIVWEAKEELSRLHTEYVIEIIFSMDLSHEQLLVLGDQQLLKVAIMNLMDNGCKYAQDQSVTIKLEGSNDNRIVIHFINVGPGIPAAIIDKIFDPFFRATPDNRIKGFGIGLSLVKRIMQLHSGELSVESRPHHQTKFTLSLPNAGKN
jgi:signal transduction histidine kinase